MGDYAFDKPTETMHFTANNLEMFFDNIPHKIKMGWEKAQIPDSNFISFIGGVWMCGNQRRISIP